MSCVLHKHGKGDIVKDNIVLVKDRNAACTFLSLIFFIAGTLTHFSTTAVAELTYSSPCKCVDQTCLEARMSAFPNLGCPKPNGAICTATNNCSQTRWNLGKHCVGTTGATECASTTLLVIGGVCKGHCSLVSYNVSCKCDGSNDPDHGMSSTVKWCVER